MTGTNGNGSNGNGNGSAQVGTSRVKMGLAQMLKGGVIVSSGGVFMTFLFYGIEIAGRTALCSFAADDERQRKELLG